MTTSSVAKRRHYHYQAVLTDMLNFKLQQPGAPPPVFTDSAIPDTVVCYQGVECKLPLSVSGSNDTSKK